MARYRFEQLTVPPATVVAPTISRIGTGPVVRVFLTVEDNAPVRYRYDGGEPTPTTGHILLQGAALTLDMAESIARLRFIPTTGVSAIIQLTYEGE